ncbi:interleukin-1 receptor type 1-like isoform X1 [Engystomops pustulosus]|uniref:interleukin-1 receptor type 1-like isoform X1 n=2 Tax=Engystomops pustulosus TaxID=76066 RepID=UPI003AFA738B
MLRLLTCTLHILTVMCLSLAEVCIDEGVEFDFEYASVGEPLYAVCPLYNFLDSNNFNVTWIRNDTQAEITSDTNARVHQDQNFLKFIPAALDDSGSYQCIFRNSTMCIKKIRRVVVFNYDDGLCYNHSIKFRSEITLTTSLTIECPFLDNYGNYWKIPVKWFKECEPLDLDSGHYGTAPKALIVKNLSTEDSGNYTCEVPFIYNGVTYKLSRTMEHTILDLEKDPEPVMLYPKNDIIEVELGTPITLSCRALFNGSTLLFWTFNESLISDYAGEDRVITGDPDETVTEDGLLHFIDLNFTKVLEEDYNRKFYCHMFYTTKSIKFYVTIKKPDPNLQGLLIAVFLSLFLVIVIAIIAIRIFKVDIVLWYRSFCLAKRASNDGKMYDAYVIYPKNFSGTSSYEMDIFVLKVLPEVLEKQCAYQLFILGRDDLPGQALMDLVDETISQSRRVIIVLGNMFCVDESDFEQKIAMYDALIRNKIKVILIEIEKITDYTTVPESIKYIKQKQGVVRWKGEFTEDALSPNTRFWKNIRYQMPPTHRYSDRELHYIHSED